MNCMDGGQGGLGGEVGEVGSGRVFGDEKADDEIDEALKKQKKTLHILGLMLAGPFMDLGAAKS